MWIDYLHRSGRFSLCKLSKIYKLAAVIWYKDVKLSCENNLILHCKLLLSRMDCRDPTNIPYDVLSSFNLQCIVMCGLIIQTEATYFRWSPKLNKVKQVECVV